MLRDDSSKGSNLCQQLPYPSRSVSKKGSLVKGLRQLSSREVQVLDKKDVAEQGGGVSVCCGVCG